MSTPSSLHFTLKVKPWTFPRLSIRQLPDETSPSHTSVPVTPTRKSRCLRSPRTPENKYPFYSGGRTKPASTGLMRCDDYAAFLEAKTATPPGKVVPFNMSEKLPYDDPFVDTPGQERRYENSYYAQPLGSCVYRVDEQSTYRWWKWGYRSVAVVGMFLFLGYLWGNVHWALWIMAQVMIVIVVLIYLG